MKRLGFHFGRNNKGSAKAQLRLSGIRITTSTHVETVVLLTRKMKPLKPTYQIEIDIPIEPEKEEKYLSKERQATYPKIKQYVEERYGVKVHTAYIAQIKRTCGMDMRKNYNLSKKEEPKRVYCTPTKAEYIREALAYYGVI